MESSNNNNNQLNFVSELKELRNELSAMKKRIVQLEESHEKQQQRIDLLERENHALKKKTQLINLDGNEEGGSVLKRKRTDQDQDTDEQTESKPPVSVSVSTGKKTKTNNNDNEEAVVIPQRDNGDSFDSLSDDLLHKIVEFDGNCYSKFGLINKRCKNIYDVKEYKLKKETCLYGYGTVDMILQHYLQKRKEDELDFDVRCYIAKTVIWYSRFDAIDWIIQLGDSELLLYVCCIAAEYGRVNVLTKVFCKCNLTMLDKLLDDTAICNNAAYDGQLETLKLLRKYGSKWDAGTFFVARGSGHDEIMQYLRDEGCPEEENDEDGDY